MSTYQTCDKTVELLAATIMDQFDTHFPLMDNKVKIDFLFAYPDFDANDEPIGDALTHDGHKALGICRKLSLKDRAKGNGDAEICLDGLWWKEASPEQRRALLDHELHHIEVKVNAAGEVMHDDLERPMLNLRKHDINLGWFNIIAQRHGEHSMERQQAKLIADELGQYYFPKLLEEASV